MSHGQRTPHWIPWKYPGTHWRESVPGAVRGQRLTHHILPYGVLWQGIPLRPDNQLNSIPDWKFTFSKGLFFSVCLCYTIDYVAEFFFYIHNNLSSFHWFFNRQTKKERQKQPQCWAYDWRSCSQLLCTFNFLPLFVLLTSIYLNFQLLT